MRVNKLIRLWVHGGRGGIYDASPLHRRTGVINAASTTTVSILLTFIIRPGYEERNMSVIKQAVSWWSFVGGDMTPQKLLRAAADIGYVAVELVEQEYWPLVKEH